MEANCIDAYGEDAREDMAKRLQHCTLKEISEVSLHLPRAREQLTQ